LNAIGASMRDTRRQGLRVPADAPDANLNGRV